MDSPQSWNRFSYVNNSPVSFNDPTGHVCSDPENTNNNSGCESGNKFVTKKEKKLSRDLFQLRHTKGSSCSDPIPSVVCKPNTTTLPNLENVSQSQEPLYETSCLLTGCIGPKPNSSNTFSGMVGYINFMNYAINGVRSSLRASTLIEKSFIWGKAFNPNPLADFIMGFTGQVISDFDRSDLSPFQRGGRSLIVGMESAVTGIISDGAFVGGFLLGEAAFEAGGGAIGGPVAAVTTSVYMDSKVWTDFNSTKFQNWGLGVP